MQLTLSLAALAASASASFAVRDESTAALGTAKVVNRCAYDVYIWHIGKQLGCSSGEAYKLSKGQTWSAPMKNEVQFDKGGYSIKISKWNECGGKELSQLEYKIDTSTKGFEGNYLDMSFVDCQVKGDCPGWHDGFYLESGKTGNKDQIYKASNDNEHCPILKASNAAEAAKISYVLPDDRQTKYCNENANLDLYLCGDQAPDASAPSSAAPSSSKAASSSSSKALPTTLQVTPSKPASSAEDVQVKAAAVTPAPQAPAPEAPKAVKTVVTYVTAYVDAPVRKRHAHGRRHNRA